MLLRGAQLWDRPHRWADRLTRGLRVSSAGGRVRWTRPRSSGDFQSPSPTCRLSTGSRLAQSSRSKPSPFRRTAFSGFHLCSVAAYDDSTRGFSGWSRNACEAAAVCNLAASCASSGGLSVASPTCRLSTGGRLASRFFSLAMPIEAGKSSMLLPAALSHAIGPDSQRAIVIVGGLSMSMSMLMNVFVSSQLRLSISGLVICAVANPAQPAKTCPHECGHGVQERCATPFNDAGRALGRSIPDLRPARPA